METYKADQTNKIKDLTCRSIDEARASAGFLLFAYVLMPDHLHILTDAPLKPSLVLQYIKGIVARRLINQPRLRRMKRRSSISVRKRRRVSSLILPTSSQPVAGNLKEQDYESSLRKLRHADWKRNHRFSLWQHDSDIFSVTSESKFMEKVNYINLNPARAGLVEVRKSTVGPVPAGGRVCRQKTNRFDSTSIR